ncbi:MAG: exodeoxyribonuclease III [Acetobacterales bacterium]
MKIATWNVNSIRARIDNVVEWLREAAPDVALLQEIKVEAGAFPREPLEDAGYNVGLVGQKSYNGVAILSKSPLSVEHEWLPGDETDREARYLEAVIEAPTPVRVATIYLPNGNPVEGDRYAFKLAWMERLRAHADRLLALEEVTVLGGDYNVIPTDDDVYDPAAWREDALFRMDVRRKFRALLNLGYTEAWRALHREKGVYSFWDYQAGRWQRNEGLRIDHLLLSPQAADRLKACEIDRGPRGRQKASDHTPVWCELEVA